MASEMTFKIHFTGLDGQDDWFIVEGDDINDLQKRATLGVEQRGGTDPWSEEVK
jgi:hypothetical protein